MGLKMASADNHDDIINWSCSPCWRSKPRNILMSRELLKWLHQPPQTWRRCGHTASLRQETHDAAAFGAWTGEGTGHAHMPAPFVEAGRSQLRGFGSREDKAQGWEEEAGGQRGCAHANPGCAGSGGSKFPPLPSSHPHLTPGVSASDPDLRIDP